MLSQSVCSWLSPSSCLSTSLSVSLCFCQCVSQTLLESKQHSIWVCLAYSRPISAITWAGWAASSSDPRLLCGSVDYASTTFSFVISIIIMGNVWSCIWNNSIYIIILLLCNITRHQKQGHCVGPHLLLLHELFISENPSLTMEMKVPAQNGYTFHQRCFDTLWQPIPIIGLVVSIVSVKNGGKK